MSIFVNNKKLLEGEVAYIYVESSNGEERPVPLASEEDREKYSDELKIIKVYFKKPNYKLFSKIMQDVLKTNPDGTFSSHPMAYREACLKNLLQKWDLKDEETGEVIPVSPDIIDNLYPEMANAILSEYDRITALDTDFIDINSINTEEKDTEEKDTEEKDTEEKDTEEKDTEEKDTEEKDIE